MNFFSVIIVINMKKEYNSVLLLHYDIGLLTTIWIKKSNEDLKPKHINDLKV